MKKIALLVLLTVLCATLSGCVCMRNAWPWRFHYDQSGASGVTVVPRSTQADAVPTNPPERRPTASPLLTNKPTDAPTPVTTAEPAQEPTTAPEASEKQAIQFPIAP